MKDRNRITLDLTPEDYAKLDAFVKGQKTKAEFIRRAVALALSIKNEEVFIVTAKGDKIPSSIVL